jgi:hypothetical protein
MALAPVASKLSRAARLATTPRRFAPRLHHHDLAGEAVIPPSPSGRVRYVCANRAAASSLGPCFLRRGLANLPAGEDSTGFPVGTEPEDLDDEDDPYYSQGKKPILDLAFSI